MKEKLVKKTSKTSSESHFALHWTKEFSSYAVFSHQNY